MRQPNSNGNLLKLYEYKYQIGAINKNQFFSIKNFIETYSGNDFKNHVLLFEAYTYLKPGKIISKLPLANEKIIFEEISSLLNINMPVNIKTEWDLSLFPDLIKTIKRDSKEILTRNIHKNFFSLALKRDFKKILFNDQKQKNSKLIKKLKKNGIDFKKWVFNTFKQKYHLPYESECLSLIKQASYIVLKALGKKGKPGFIKNNEKLYTRIEPYLIDGRIRNLKSLKLALEEILASWFSDKNNEEFYRNSIEILLKEAEDIEILDNLLFFEFWQRDPAGEIFIGSKIDTCLSVKRRSFYCLLDFFLDLYMNVIKIKLNNEIIGLAYVFIMKDEKSGFCLLFDNVEFADKYKKLSIFTNQTLDYFSFISRQMDMDYYYLGTNHNDILLPDLKTEQVYLEKIALENGKKYYMDAFNGYSYPFGKIKVFKIFNY